jgi:uncharacterized membrane protein
MIRSFLIGLIAGARSMTPLATVSEAARSGRLPANKAVAFLGHPLVAAGAKAIAAGELLGDKMKSAPDRIVPAGIAARVIAGGLVGAALAPRRRQALGAVVGATAAIGASYLTFTLRMRALRRYGQTPSGIVEDALAVGAAQLVTSSAGLRRSRFR